MWRCPHRDGSTRPLRTAWPPSRRPDPLGGPVALWSPRCAVEVTTSTLLLRTLDDPVIREALVWAAHLTGTTLLRRALS